MAIRLVKIAKELNVGTGTIVEFLKGKGYEIDNKPTSKISDEMHEELLQEYKSSMQVKEKADSIVIGTRFDEKKEKAPEPTVKKEEKKEPVQETPEPEVKEEKPTPEVVEKVVVEEKEEKKSGAGLKVVGKIDLDREKKAKEKAKKEAEEKAKKEAEAKKKAAEEKAKAEAKAKAAEKEKEAKKEEEKKVAEVKKEEKKEKAEKGTDEVITADAPTLEGLKVKGKIDLDKFKPKKKAKPEKKESDKDPNKRKRKRKTFKKSFTKGGNKKGKTKKEEVKEVTQKEIDEKIKATMARMSGGSNKNKRQRIRRENRDEKKEKLEAKEAAERVENAKLKVTEFISVSEIASLMDVPVTDVIMACMNLGVIVSINQRLDAEVIELVATEFEFEVEFISAEEQMDSEVEFEDDPEDLQPRAPIVTVMGHVDHGKTSLLDHIREANVAEGEAGGITQHIGAYEVKAGPDKKKITFLDTPGHEAFTAMRARGAKLTDVAVIIIAADDKIMPQTKEAIAHAQAAGVPIVFAINKIDKDGANPDYIKQELASQNLLIEEWGGKYQSQDISAKTGLNIDKLLEKILLEAELLELQANPDREAHGTIVEATLEKGRGYATNILVQTGTLKIGDYILAGSHSGRVKAMFNEHGKRVKLAGPSTPVMILGLDGAPQAGETFKVMDNEQEAKQLASKRAQIEREQSNRASKRISLDEIGRRLALGSFKELNLIVKGDVDGSIEALSDSLIKLSVEEIQVNVIHKAVGQIIESDVLLASASDAIVIGFQVRPSGGARDLAEREGVEIKTYSIIYEAIEEIKAAMEGMLEPDKEEQVTGEVEVRETFKISKVGTIAGCYVQNGKITRNSFIRIIRDGIVVYPNKEGVVGELASLKRFKDDVKEVKAGFECGLNINNFNDIKVGDIIEAYEIVEVKKTLK